MSVYVSLPAYIPYPLLTPKGPSRRSQVRQSRRSKVKRASSIGRTLSNAVYITHPSLQIYF
jgi:hypothetical protein